MASYNRIKATKIAPIGTIMPWGGGSRQGQSLDNVPPGWIVCNLTTAQLNAADYPLLAKVMGNTYGPPVPEGNFQIGVNWGIVNNFPYNPPLGREGHNPNAHVDTFALPNLNQVALVDIEANRETDSEDPNSSALTVSDLSVLTTTVSKNGTEGDLPDILQDSNVDITFTLEPSQNLAGRITGIVMEDPIYFDTVYVIPRKLGIDHIPSHNHRPASDSEFDQFWGAQGTGTPILQFQPGKGEQAGDGSGTTSVTAVGQRGNFPHSFKSQPEYNLTWYNPDNPNDIMVPGLDRVEIDAAKGLVPDNTVLTQGRTIEARAPIENDYTDDNRAVSNIQQPAYTGVFPPAGRYQGKRNFYASPDIPSEYRGGNMPTDYVDDVPYDPASTPQPINTAVTNTFTTTLNHEYERWLDIGLQSHTHDAMEIVMSKGSLGTPTTLLVNNVSTGSAIPLNVDTALSIQMNINTPSLTVMYIIRAF
tara:strand:- start:10714 stop:12138 length:1425 start_codon:yes stop_codon:yes gene_type:complete